MNAHVPNFVENSHKHKFKPATVLSVAALTAGSLFFAFSQATNADAKRGLAHYALSETASEPSLQIQEFKPSDPKIAWAKYVVRVPEGYDLQVTPLTPDNPAKQPSVDDSVKVKLGLHKKN